MFRFQKWNQNFFVATNLFADIGRVWQENPTLTLKNFQLARGGRDADWMESEFYRCGGYGQLQ